MKRIIGIAYIALTMLSVAACSTTEKSSEKKPVARSTNLVKEPSFVKAAKEEMEACREDGGQGLISDAKLDEMLGIQDERRFKRGPKYFFSFVDADIREALMELSIQSKLPITIDENVTGQISIDIKGETFLDALKMILATGPFDYKFTGSFFYVGQTDSKEKSWLKLSHSYRYKLLHVKPSIAEKLINSVYKDAFRSDDSLGVISIYAPRGIMKQIIQIIAGIDRRSKQVLLKLSIAEITGKGDHGMGRYFGSMGNALGIVNGLAPIQPAFQSAVLTKAAYSEFLGSITILNKQGRADVKAQPKIIVQDGEKAEFKSLIKTLLKNDSRTAISKLNFIETGITLILLPSIVENDEISLAVLDASSGDFDISETTQINEHSVKTKVRVKPGETLLLGGMISKKKKVITRKVPWLGDIPYLGWLFR